MKQILFISYDGLTDPLGQSQILPYLMGLTKHGYEFTILSCEKPQRYAEKKGLIEDIIKGYPIHWAPLKYHKKPPILSSVYDFRNMWQAAKKLHVQKKFDLVHTRSGIATLVALKMKKKFGVKYLNDVRGFWADERVDGNLWDLKNPVYRSVYNFFKAKETECFHVNDYTTCLTYKAKEQILQWNLLKNPENITVIPCSVDLDLFNPDNVDPAKVEELKQKFGIKPGNVVISYVGSIGTWYMIDEMMQFFQVFLRREPKVKFLMLINGSEHEKVRIFMDKYSIPAGNVILTETIRRNVPTFLSCCDYSVFFIKPCFSKLSSSPTKHGEVMALGLPVITNAGVGDLEEIVEKYDSGFLVRKFTEQEYGEIIDKLLTTQFDKQKIRRGAYEFYSLQIALEKYSYVYGKTIGHVQ
jgi:glycosyltransferase involved in cell wall biosynthesis